MRYHQTAALALDLEHPQAHTRSAALPPWCWRRYTEEMQSIVGMFVSTLALRLTQSDERVADAMATAQQVVRDALQRAHVPLYKVVAKLRLRRATSYSPLFQALFQVTAADQSTLEVTINNVDEPTVKVDLDMQLFHCDGQVLGRLIYDAAIYNSSTVRRWI
eukprot:3765618-Prymnesium_polylepis.1